MRQKKCFEVQVACVFSEEKAVIRNSEIVGWLCKIAKYLCQSLLSFDKVAGLRGETLLERDSKHRVSL